MDVLPEPLPQLSELTRTELLVQLRDGGVAALPELTGDQVAERVRAQVADQPGRPVDVLEDAVGIVGDVSPQVLLEAGVPNLRQLRHRQPALDQLALELEPEHD